MDPSPGAAFDAFFLVTYPELLKFGYWLSGNWHDAEDAAEEVMVDIWRRWSTIRAGGRVAYARTALFRTIIRIRRVRRDRVTYLMPNDAIAAGAGGEPQASAYETEEWINQLLDHLGPAQQAVVDGFLTGKTVREMADEQRRSEPAIRKNMQLARERLQPLVAEHHGPPPRSTTRAEETR
jgi:RNA polymerase sigma factor (sigma-70 family)